MSWAMLGTMWRSGWFRSTSQPCKLYMWRWIRSLRYNNFKIVQTSHALNHIRRYILGLAELLADWELQLKRQVCNCKFWNCIDKIGSNRVSTVLQYSSFAILYAGGESGQGQTKGWFQRRQQCQIQILPGLSSWPSLPLQLHQWCILGVCSAAFGKLWRKGILMAFCGLDQILIWIGVGEQAWSKGSRHLFADQRQPWLARRPPRPRRKLSLLLQQVSIALSPRHVRVGPVDQDLLDDGTRGEI